MFKLIKNLTQAFALIGVVLICANGYTWYATGEWGTASFLDMLSYVSGAEVQIPEAEDEFLHNLVN